MFLRIRWFIVGFLASFSFVVYLASQLRRAREQLTAQNLANFGMRRIAGLLDSVARRVGSTGGPR